MEMMFNANPARIISGIVILPELKILALGGVATGIIKAQDAAMAAPAKSGNTSMSSEIPMVISPGRIMLAVAVLDVISVTTLIPALIRIVKTATGRKLR